jgi:type II secretory pathway pseudopilin PulG
VAAFSLVELLVVIGLIGLLAGAGAMAIAGRGGEGVSLSNSQSIVTSLVGQARAQAALHQTNARLIVYAQLPPAANADSTKYLRMLQVVRFDTLPNGTTAWVAAGDPVTLPLPICIVPPAPIPATHLGTGVAWNNNVATGPVSTLVVATGFSYRGQATANATQFFGVQGQNGRILYVEFGPDGSVTPTKIAVTTAVMRAGNTPQFNNASGVRGLWVRRSGAISFVNDATSF